MSLFTARRVQVVASFLWSDPPVPAGRTRSARAASSIVSCAVHVHTERPRRYEAGSLAASASIAHGFIPLLGIRCAAELGSDCVSVWSGAVRDGVGCAEATTRLLDGLCRVLDYAAGQGILVGFEPEPGMLIDSMEHFDQLLGRHGCAPTCG